MIFISYSWVDKAFVNSVRKAIGSLGLYCWIDHENLDLTRCLETQIYFALKQSNFMLQIVSDASNKSDWVKFESQIALENGIHIKRLVMCDDQRWLDKILMRSGDLLTHNRGRLFNFNAAN